MIKAIYIRTSTDDQTPEHQLQDISNLVRIQECQVYQDQQSAWREHAERAEFNSLLQEIKRGQVSSLYVWDLDRIYRDRERLKSFFELCKYKGVKVFSYRQQWLSDLSTIPEPWNEVMMEMLINIFGWIAEEESSKKSERIRKSQVKKDGRTFSRYGKAWGRRPLPKQTINRVLALADEGYSVRKIGEMVKTTDHNKNQKNIGKSTVHKIITEYRGEKGSKTGHVPN